MLGTVSVAAGFALGTAFVYGVMIKSVRDRRRRTKPEGSTVQQQTLEGALDPRRTK